MSFCLASILPPSFNKLTSPLLESSFVFSLLHPSSFLCTYTDGYCAKPPGGNPTLCIHAASVLLRCPDPGGPPGEEVPSHALIQLLTALPLQRLHPPVERGEIRWIQEQPLYNTSPVLHLFCSCAGLILQKTLISDGHGVHITFRGCSLDGKKLRCLETMTLG